MKMFKEPRTNEGLEPKNHPTENENHPNQTSVCVFHVSLQGVHLARSVQWLLEDIFAM